MSDQPQTVGDCEPDRELYKTTNMRGARKSIHLDGDCHALNDCRTLTTVARNEYDGDPICSYCNDSCDTSGTHGPDTAAQIKGAWAE